jgi:hypothetical protein
MFQVLRHRVADMYIELDCEKHVDSRDAALRRGPSSSPRGGFLGKGSDPSRRRYIGQQASSFTAR